VTDSWRHRFKERQSKLSLQRGDLTDHVCMDSINKKNIGAYCNLLEETLQKNNLSECPAHIYNMDKTRIPFDPHPPNVAK